MHYSANYTGDRSICGLSDVVYSPCNSDSLSLHSPYCLIYTGPYSEHRPSVHDSLLRRDAAPTKKYDVDVTVPVKLIYLRIPISTESRLASCAVVSDGTEVGCVRSGATKSAGTLSIEI